MKKLSDLAVNKDNNFNLIRFLSAVAVLAGHCFPLATGAEANLWIGHYLGISLGSIAVDVFFITSGFLVTGSLLSHNDTFKFIRARILRVYPALLVMLFFTTVFLGTYFTSMPSSDYLASPGTLSYLLKNASLFTGVIFTLPGVFESNPYQGTVNGSLWTLPYEIWMYGALVLLWITLYPAPQSRLRIYKFTIVILALFSVLTYNAIKPGDTNYYQFIKLFSMFFTGSAYFVLQKRITLSLPLFCFTAVALGVSMIDKDVFHVVYSLTLAYLLICAAYMPTGRIRAFNRFGDYSYGVYIYAFPVQQSVAAFFSGISVAVMLPISLLVTLLLAMLSWHFIEKPALALKYALSNGYSSR